MSKAYLLLGDREFSEVIQATLEMQYTFWTSPAQSRLREPHGLQDKQAKNASIDFILLCWVVKRVEVDADVVERRYIKTALSRRR